MKTVLLSSDNLTHITHSPLKLVRAVTYHQAIY
jgi:hypothetical protein